MRRLALFVALLPSIAVAQVQIQGSAVQIGGNQPGVSSIQGQTGDFTLSGDGFGGCSTTDGVTTCIFNESPISLTTNGTGGPSTLSSGILNIPVYSGGGGTGQCFLGSGGLVGAFTDGSGIVKPPFLCIGNGPASFTVPTGATQLQIGINDGQYANNLGSFSINVSKNGAAASPVTVPSLSMPWSPTANPSYSYGQNDGASPTVALTGLVSGDVITLTYVSGTVQLTPLFPFTDANGYLTIPPGPSCEGGPTGTTNCDSLGVLPTYYMSSAYSFSAITGLTGDGTATGPGTVPFTLSNTTVTPGSYTNLNATIDAKGRITSAANGTGGGGTPGGTTGELQYNNSGAFGGDSGSTTDGAGNVTTKTVSTTGTVAGQGGTWDATEGTAPSAASGHDKLYADSTAHCIKQSLNGGSFACLGAASGTVTTTGSPASGNLTKFSGSSSITSGDLSGDVTTSGTLATTVASNAITTAKINNAAVTYAKMQNVSANSVLLGSGATGSGAAPVEITLGSGLTMAGTTLSASGGGSSSPFINVQDSPYSAKGDGQIAWDGTMHLTVPTPFIATSTVATAPGVTTNFANDVVVSIFFNFSTTWGTPSAGTARLNVAGSGTANGILVSDQTVASPGSVANITSTLGASAFYYGASIPLVPTSGNTISFVASTNQTLANTGSSITLAQPTGAAAGDVEVACLTWFTGSGNTLTSSPQEFPAFNFSITPVTTYATGNHQSWCWTRLVKSSDPASYTWTQTSSAGGMVAVIADYRNVGGIDNPFTQTAWSASTSFPLSSQIRDSNGCLEQASATGTSGSTTPTWPACTTGNAGNTTSDGSITWILRSAAPSFTSADSGKLLCVNNTQPGVFGSCGYVGNVVSTTEFLPIGFANTCIACSGAQFYDMEYRYASDDTAAIQSALNAAPATVIIPKGNYGLSAPLKFPILTPIVVQGIAAASPFDLDAVTNNYLSGLSNSNLGSSWWVLTNKLTSAAIQMIAAGTVKEQSIQTTLQNVAIYAGVGTGRAGGGSDGIEILNWCNTLLDRVFVENFAGNGVYIDASASTGTFYSAMTTISQSYIAWNGKNGVLVGTTGSYIDPTTVEKNDISFNALAGIKTAGTVNALTITGNQISGNNNGLGSGNEINFTGSVNGMFFGGNYIETGCDGDGSNVYLNYVSSMAAGTTLAGNYYSTVCTSPAVPNLQFSAAGIPLPAASARNAHFAPACVSDSTACTAGTTYVSGGTQSCQVQSNGTNWLETGATCY